MTTFICPPQELPTEKVRQIVRDAGCDWPEDDSRESRLWRFNVRRIVEAAWHRGFAAEDHNTGDVIVTFRGEHPADSEATPALSTEQWRSD